LSPVQACNILRHELIGLQLRVLKSSYRRNVGLRGRVLDETRNLIVVSTVKGPRMVPKNGSTFEFMLQDGASTRVDGGALVGNPEDRVLRR